MGKTKEFVRRVKNSPNHETKLAKRLKKSAFVLGIIVILAAAASIYFFITSKPPISRGTPQQQAAQIIAGTSRVKQSAITSTLGFTVEYVDPTLSVEAQTTDPSSTDTKITGESYNGQDLTKARPYSIIKFSIPPSNNKLSSDYPELTILTNIRKNYWQSRQAEPGNANKSKIDILTDQTTASEASNGYILNAKKDISIGNIAYRQVTYTQTSESFGVKSTSEDVYYLTIQNDRPYTAEITQINNPSDPVMTQYQAIIKGITYQVPDSNALAFSLRPTARLADASTSLDSLPTGTSNIPNALDTSTLISVVAANQPAVVRIGAIDCSDIQLLYPDGSVGATLTNACNGGTGSGSFVSSDGYIATNAHVTVVSATSMISGYIELANDSATFTDHLKTVLTYLVQTGLASPDDIDTFIQLYNSGDSRAQTFLNQIGTYIPTQAIKVINEKPQYAIQTSDTPMHYDFTKNTFNYGPTILAAKFIDADDDLATLEGGSLGSNAASTRSDVSILKADGTFPVAQLGSIDSVTEGDELTAIGFPGFVDNALQTTQTKTVPSITQGLVEDIGAQSSVNPHILLVTTVPIAHGNSGGPAFNSKGQEIGLNTYGNITCPDQKCFGDGTVRDIADYKALLAKNSITLNTDSTISTTWHEGLEDLVKADYASALSNLKKSASLYPANTLATSFIAIAQTQVDIQTAARNALILRIVLIVGGVLLVAAIVVGIILVVHLSRHKPQPPTGGGDGATPTPPMSPITSQQPPQTPLQPPTIQPAQTQAPITPPASPQPPIPQSDSAQPSENKSPYFN